MSDSVAILGGGMTGLTAAYRLGEKGVRSVVYERRPVLGGLASTVTVAGEPLEMFYHHWFRSDLDVIALTEELGLSDRLMWLPSRISLWHKDGAYPLNTPFDLLRFRHLGFLDKLRFGLSTLYLQKRTAWEAFDGLSCREWMTRWAGRRATEVVWMPLLRAKFGRHADDIALAWLWGKVHLRGASRAGGVGREYLGYMDGTFAPLVERLVERAVALGARIERMADVRGIRPRSDGRLEVVTSRGTETHSRVLSTLAFPALLPLVPDMDGDWRRRVAELDYIGTVCVLLINRRRFSDIYWQNISDPDIPFCGLIEHTNFIGGGHYGGRHLLYIANYVHRDDPFFQLSNRAILDAYEPHLRRINPEFSRDWIERAMVFRAEYAQPIVRRGYRHRVPGCRTPLPNLWSANMAQIYPEDRGMNYAVRSANRVVAEMLGVPQWAGT